MTTDLVIDVSLAAAFLLREPAGKRLEPILLQAARGEIIIHVPSLFSFELLNILVMAERHKRVTTIQGNQLLLEWDIVPVSEDVPPDLSTRRRILTIARDHHLTAYDAAYIELADRLQAKLVSLDADILKLKNKFDWVL